MSVAKNSLIIFLSQVVVLFLLFLSTVIIAVKFGPEGKGIFDLFISVTGLFSIIGTMGIGTASIYIINKKGVEISSVFSNIIFLGTASSIILDLFLFVGILLFPSVFSGLSTNYLFLLFITIPLGIFHNYLLSIYLAKSKIIKWAFFSFFYTFLIFLGTILSSFVFLWGIGGVIYSVLFSAVFTFLIIFIDLCRLIPLKFYFNWDLFVEEIKFGLSVYLGDIFKTVIQKMNLIIISIFLGIVSVGYYSVSLNLNSIMFLIIYSFQQVFYSKWSFSDEKNIDKITPEVARQSFIVGIFVAIFLFIFGKFFIINIYGKAFSAAVLPFYIILPGATFMIFAGTFFNNFFAKGKSWITSLILIIVLIINIVTNIILVPKIGIIGSASAASISYFFATVLAVLFFSKISGYGIVEIIKFKKSDFTAIYKSISQLVVKILRK